MAKFKYRAMNSDGDKIDGTYEADSKQGIIDFIASNGYYPLKVEEIIESTNIDIKFSSKVKLKDIAIFCRQFYTMLNAGVPILTCLNILSNQVQNEHLRKSIREIEDEVKKGGILSAAMKNHSDVFPGLLVSLVEAGEASGTLDEIMLRMANNYEKENKINNKIKGAMIYPIVLSIVATVAVTFILTYVMPTFMEIFESTGTELPWSTNFLIQISNGIKNNWFLIIVSGMIIGIVINIFLKTEEGILVASKLKLKLPILKKLNEMIIVSRFTRTLSTLIASGLPLVEGLRIVSTVAGNKVAEDTLMKIRENVIKGENLYSSMSESEIFPPMLYSMIKIGEETGTLEEILNKTADFYDEELETTIQTSVSLLEPILIVIMGLLMGFIIISIMLPMFDSYNQI